MQEYWQILEKQIFVPNMRGVEIMNRKIAGLVLVFMLFLANNVFATNWIYVQKNADTTVYFDADTAFQQGETLTFWVRFVYDPPMELDVKKHMWQYVVTTSRPRTFKTLVGYAYDSNNNQIAQVKGRNYGRSLEGTSTDKAVTKALQCAKTGQDNGIIPTP